MTNHELIKKADLWLILHNLKDFRGTALECKRYCRYYFECIGIEYAKDFILIHKQACIKWLDDE